MAKLTQEKVLEQFKEVHGDRYDYSLFEYKASLEKSKIICPIHGVFEQTPSSHKNGAGCPKCLNRNLSRTEIINQFNLIHNNFYDYSLMNYINNNTNIEIICPEHGVFKQTPANHKKGQGCPICSKKKKKEKMQKESMQILLKQFKEVHGDIYDYSKFTYTSSTEKGIVICPIHGEFEISPYSHKNGSGCPICRKEDALKLSEKEFLKDFKIVHGDKYDYSKFKNKGSKKKSIFICPIHGEFEQTPYSHKNGNGCPNCSNLLTQDIILEQFREVHGDRYDYSKFIYQGAQEKGIIICPEHGEFEQRATIHKNGSGCPKCTLQKTSREEILKDFEKVHGNKYDYSEFIYDSTKRKGTIICPIHGKFEQDINKHKNGAGCPICSGRRQNQEFMLKDFKEVHGDRYDYSKSIYNGAKNKIQIICKEHGVFEQTPSQHKSGKGCPKCSGRVSSNEELIEIFRKVHGDKYDYSKFKVNVQKDKGIIICPEHGEFIQSASNHRHGAGCPRCKGQNNTQEIILEKCHAVHGETYDYSLLKFTKVTNKVKIICKEHGIFEQTLRDHLYGQGCPQCAKYGFDKSMPSILYYLKIEVDGIVTYKIGITNRSVKERFNGDIKYITVIKEWYYEDGEECFNQEQRILREFEYAKWKGESLLKNGNSEMFDRDVLLLDV